MKSTVVDFETISQRICELKQKGKFRKLSLLNICTLYIHASSEDKSYDIKEKFYDKRK